MLVHHSLLLLGVSTILAHVAATGNPESSGGDDVEEYHLLVDRIEALYYPLLLLLGVAGNLLSVAALRTTIPFRRSSAALCLSALALSDTAVLLGRLGSTFATGHGSRTCSTDLARLICPAVAYAAYAPVSLSAWLVLAFTTERFVAVRYPIRGKSFCTRKRARVVLGILVILSLLVNAPVLFLVRDKIWMESLEPGVFEEGYSTTVAAAMKGVLDPDRASSCDEADPSEGPLDGADSGTSPGATRCIVGCGVCHECKGLWEIFQLTDTALSFVGPALGIAVLNTLIVAVLRRGRMRWRWTGPSRPQIVGEDIPWSDESPGKVHPIIALRSSPSEGDRVESSPEATEDTSSLNHGLCRNARFLEPLNAGNSAGVPCDPSGEPSWLKARRRRWGDGARVTGILFVVSSAFLLLNLPHYAILIVGNAQLSSGKNATEEPTSTSHLAVLQRVAEMLYYTNFGINFLLYCAFGRNFRRALRVLFRRVWRKFRSTPPGLGATRHHGGEWRNGDSWTCGRRANVGPLASCHRLRTSTVTSETSTREQASTSLSG